MNEKTTFDSKLDLTFERVVDLKPEQIWKAWTTPKILLQWFCPRPWKTIECEIDLMPGGIFKTVMQSPSGENVDNLGCFLEVIENRKLVWTDAMLPGFRPAPAPISGAGFMFTGILLFEPHGNGTKYTAIVKHQNEADCKQHREMGFYKGWGIALDQLIEVMKKD